MSYADPKPGEACKVCGSISRDFRQRACVNCAVLGKVYRSIGTGRDAAIRLVKDEIKAGRLIPPKALTCVDCGNPAQVYEHRDYNRPLDVVAACRSCNAKRGPAKPKNMTFDEFMTAVRQRYPFAMNEQFESIRRKYFSKEQA